jgi:hypothetical protein
MAIGRLSVKVGKAGSAGPHAAYIARIGRYASRLEHGEKLEATGAGNMPAWASNPLDFWKAADAFERKNGTTYREMEIALPRELLPDQRAELVRAFVRQELGDKHAYQWAIHSPKAADGFEQPHVHLMFSERQRDGIERDPDQYFKRYNAKSPEKGGARKGYGEHAGQTLNAAQRRADLKALRGRWGETANRFLEHAGVAERVDMRSNAERGLVESPEPKQLPSQWRGAGRELVLERRAARVDDRLAPEQLRQLIPDPGHVLSELRVAGIAARTAKVEERFAQSSAGRARAEREAAALALAKSHDTIAQWDAALKAELDALRLEKIAIEQPRFDGVSAALERHLERRPTWLGTLFDERKWLSGPSADGGAIRGRDQEPMSWDTARQVLENRQQFYRLAIANLKHDPRYIGPRYPDTPEEKAYVKTVTETRARAKHPELARQIDGARQIVRWHSEMEEHRRHAEYVLQEQKRSIEREQQRSIDRPYPGPPR